MSKQRARKKQRRRARAGGATATERAQERAAARSAAAAESKEARPARSAQCAAPARPSRLEVRDGVARPDPVWAPFPLTEIAIAIGMVLFGLGYFASADRSPALLGGGALVLVVAVAELCLREHFAGYRSHSILLALLPVTAGHTFVVYAVTRTWRGPLALAIDLAIAGTLAWYLHVHFAAAQRRARR